MIVEPKIYFRKKYIPKKGRVGKRKQRKEGVSSMSMVHHDSCPLLKVENKAVLHLSDYCINMIVEC